MIFAFTRWVVLNLLQAYELLEKAWGPRFAQFTLRLCSLALILWVADVTIRLVSDASLAKIVSAYVDVLELSVVVGHLSHRVLYFIGAILVTLAVLALSNVLTGFLVGRATAIMRKEREALQREREARETTSPPSHDLP